MWSCWSARRMLPAYQDGELVTVKAQSIEDHLRQCAHCTGELAELRRVTLLVRSLPEPSRPREYWPQALQRLRGKIQEVPRSTKPSVLGLFLEMLDSPVRAVVPAALVGMALVNTVLFLGLEEEALAFFSTYLLPIILD